MKTKLLVAAVMFFCFTLVAAYAATQYTVGSTPETTVVESGKTEKTGDITFATAPSSGATVTGTITIDYLNPITVNNLATVIQDVIANDGNTPPAIGVPVIEDGNKLTFTITPSATTPSLDYAFRVTGVRVDVAGSPGSVPLDARISSTGNTITVGQTEPRVIQAAEVGIASFSGTTPVRINSVSGAYAAGSPTSVILTGVEGFRNAFGVTNATEPTQNNPQMIKVELSPIPAGVTLFFPATATSSIGVWTANVTTLAGPIAAPAVYYTITTDTDVANVENFVISSVAVTAAPVTTSAYEDQTIYASITLAAIYNEIGYTGYIPRYVKTLVGPVPIVEFFHPTTTLLVPFAYNNAPVEDEPVYNTGLTIANITVDPGATAMGFPSAVPQDGTFMFYLYSNTGDVYTVDSTELDPKDILDDGMLLQGSTYTILLSEVLDAAEAPEDFNGYVFIVCQFTNGHGEYFVSDFNHFSHGALMLVVTGSRNVTAESLNN